MNPDPRSEEHPICGITFTDLGGREWICIKKPHDVEYKRKTGRSGHVYGTGAHPERQYGVQAAPADRHYFVKRYPAQGKRDE